VHGNEKEHVGERGLASEKGGMLPLYFAEQDNHTVGDLILDSTSLILASLLELILRDDKSIYS
jgi:hypothetical protein